MQNNARRVIDAAYRTLSDFSDGSFPVSPLQIARRMGIRVVDREHISALLDLIMPHGDVIEAPAFTFAFDGQRFIVIDRSRGNVASRRAWLAHELGHIVLGDEHGDSMWKVHQLILGTFQRSLMDLSCDLFAASLLAPQAVLAMGGVHSATDIANVCMVSSTTAHLVAGAIQLRSAEYQPAELEAWDRMADGLRARLAQIHWPQSRAVPAWVHSDISSELTY